MNSPTPLRRMTLRLAGITVASVLMASCSNDAGEPTSTTPDSVSPATEPATTEPSTTDASTPTTEPVELEQPAIWPGAGDVFSTPQSVAEDFIVRVFGIPPDIGEFMAGDARSGEIEVYSPGDVRTLRAILLLRQLGPNNSWFIIGTLNDNAVITNPAYAAEIDIDDVSEVIVEGMAEGFEASLTVYAYVAGRTDILDQETTMGGNFGVPGPFQVTLDLTGVEPGDIVMLLVRGGVGLETDPGEFGAIPILITD